MSRPKRELWMKPSPDLILWLHSLDAHLNAVHGLPFDGYAPIAPHDAAVSASGASRVPLAPRSRIQRTSV